MERPSSVRAAADGGDTKIELVAGRRLKVHGQPFEDAERDDNAPSARVVWIDEDEGAGEQTVEGADPRLIHPEEPARKDATAFDAVARRLASELPALVEEWKDLVRKTDRERTPNHIELVESHLGTMPDPEKHPARLACYVAGLINPIPGMGVAYEVRSISHWSPYDRVHVVNAVP
jgi:hypothetical protein